MALTAQTVDPVENHRHAWIDTLRLFAGLSMVGLHATSDAAGQPFANAEIGERVAPLLLRAVLYSARTELFLMISVLLLLMALERCPRSYSETMTRQARRLLVPFVFWVVFFAFFGLIKAQAFGYGTTELARLSAPSEWIGFLLLGDVKYHMHFIPTLFGLLLFFPLFKAAELAPILGVLVLAMLLVKQVLDGFLYGALWGEAALPYALRLVKILTYVGYGLAAGAVLGLWRRTPVSIRISWVPILGLLAALMFFVKLISSWQVIQSGAWNHGYVPAYWADFLMPVMLLALCMCCGHLRWPDWASRVSKYSFGIYLAHPIFLDLAEIALKDLSLKPIAEVGLKLIWTVPMTTGFVVLIGRFRSTAWSVGLGPLPAGFRPARIFQDLK